MSHITDNKIKGIDHSKVTEPILRRALELLEMAMDVEYVDVIEDYYGNKTEVPLGIRIPDKYGIGFRVDKDGLHMLHDTYGSKGIKLGQQNDTFVRAFNRAYTTAALEHVAKKRGRRLTNPTYDMQRQRYQMTVTGGW